jgi:hypothetical protein
VEIRAWFEIHAALSHPAGQLASTKAVTSLMGWRLPLLDCPFADSLCRPAIFSIGLADIVREDNAGCRTINTL